MSLAERLREAFQDFQATEKKCHSAERKRNPNPNEIAAAMEARAAARTALDQVVVLLRQEEVLALKTPEQAKAFTQFFSQFPDCGNLSQVSISADVEERRAARMRTTLTEAGFGARPWTFRFSD